MSRILYQDDYVTIVWEDRGIVAHYDATPDYDAHEVLLGTTLAQALDALHGQTNTDIAKAVLWEVLPRADKWATTCSIDGVTELEAIQVPWDDICTILGYHHEGSAEDDEALTRTLLATGAPEWVADADGWVDEYGWGLIGPEIEGDA